METVITGYCRASDQARTLMVEYEDGVWDYGCSFPDCKFAADCPIGNQLSQLTAETEA